jgi:hypothetical protein
MDTEIKEGVDDMSIILEKVSTATKKTYKQRVCKVFVENNCMITGEVFYV